MSKNLYGSDDSLITGGIIYDETEETTQDLINAEQKKAGVYYCTCSTAASTQKKTVTISGITALYDGLKIRVRFTNEQSYNGVPTLDLNSLGAWPINRDSTGMAGQYEWTGGEVLDLVYDSTLQRWVIVGGERASEGHYGKTKLFTSVLSPSTNMAATPASVKQVNDKVGDGVLDSGFTATNLTGAANELKNTLTALDTKVDNLFFPTYTGSETRYNKLPAGVWRLPLSFTSAAPDSPDVACMSGIAYAIITATSDQNFVIVISPYTQKIYMRTQFGTWNTWIEMASTTGSSMASGTMGTGMGGTCYGIKINGMCVVLGTVAIAAGASGSTTLATAPIGYRPTALQNCILGTYVNGTNFQTLSNTGGMYTLNQNGEITQHMTNNAPAGTVAVYVFAFTI